MSSPRSAPIYAWGEKPGPSRIEEEEEDRRPPEEEEVEETVPVPVPATSLPEKKVGTLSEASAPPPSLAPGLRMASFVVAVLDGPDQHPYPGTALEMASFVVAVLDGPDRHPYPGTALTILVEMASFVVAVLDGPDRHPYPGTALTIRVESTNPPGNLFPQREADTDHLKMASFVVTVLDGPDRHPYPGTALTILVEVPSPWTASPSMLERERATPQLAQIRDGVGTRSGYKPSGVLDSPAGGAREARREEEDTPPKDRSEAPKPATPTLPLWQKQRALAGRGAFCKAELCSGCPGLPAKG
ncbi:UNVERIFIED_CONTAM: hypothetical protein K2H54_005014 [Gekko kuhli]